MAKKKGKGNVPGGIPAIGRYDMMPLHQVAQGYDLCFATLDQTAWRFQIGVRNVSVQELYDRGFDPDTIDDLKLQNGAMEFIFHVGALRGATEADLVHRLIQSTAPRILVPVQFGRDLCKSLTGAHWDTSRMNGYAARMVS